MAGPVLKVRKVIDTLTPKLSAMQAKQMPFAIALSLTRTGQAVRKDLTDELSKAFDRPTRYTLGALAALPATKSKPTATVLIKEDSAKGTAPSKFLAAEVAGGQRKAKRFERALQIKGILPAGWLAVPGRAVSLDSSGNVPGPLYVAVLSDLKAFAETGYLANRVTKAEARASKGARKHKRASRFFVVRPGARGQAGIYRITGAGVEPVFIFVRSVQYGPRYKFFELAERSALRRFPTEFYRAFQQAIVNAK